jgi:NitT/TauT family transport system substrate-binding protein
VTLRPARAAGPIRVVTSPIDAAAEPYYARDMGFFKTAGIEVDIQAMGNGAAVSAAVASNTVDIGFANLMSIAVAYRRGVPFTLIAPGSVYDHRVPTTTLMVPNGSTIRTARDLTGKTLAAAGLKTITEFAPRAWIDAGGGDAGSVKFVEMSMPQIIDAFAAGRIDAAVLAEPFLTAAKPVARTLANVYDAIAPRFLVGAFFTTTDWAKANPASVERFARAMADVARWANAHPAQSLEILQKYTKLEPATAKAMLRIGYADRFIIPEMQPMIDVLARYGGIPETFGVDRMIFKG